MDKNDSGDNYENLPDNHLIERLSELQLLIEENESYLDMLRKKRTNILLELYRRDCD